MKKVTHTIGAFGVGLLALGLSGCGQGENESATEEQDQGTDHLNDPGHPDFDDGTEDDDMIPMLTMFAYPDSPSAEIVESVTRDNQILEDEVDHFREDIPRVANPGTLQEFGKDGQGLAFLLGTEEETGQFLGAWFSGHGRDESDEDFLRVEVQIQTEDADHLVLTVREADLEGNEEIVDQLREVLESDEIQDLVSE